MRYVSAEILNMSENLSPPLTIPNIELGNQFTMAAALETLKYKFKMVTL
jgi:hypothetical protein